MDDSGKNMAFWNTLFGKSGEESEFKKNILHTDSLLLVLKKVIHIKNQALKLRLFVKKVTQKKKAVMRIFVCMLKAVPECKDCAKG